MNTSNAFSEYMVTYSVNRSINLSPTSGRLHRQKERGSYGPTICLLNRSREKIEESTAADSKQQALLERVLMLSIEVERLGHALKEAKTEGEEKLQRSRHREATFLRDQNEKLKTNLGRLEALKTEHDRRHNVEVLQLREKLGAAESQARGYARRLREAQQQALELQKRRKARESQAERAKLEASRMEMSMHFNSTNIDLHKSVARQKALQAESLREKVVRCQDIITDQKFLIAGQKEELAKEKIRQTESQNRHHAQMEALRSRHSGQLDALRRQLEFTQRQLMNKSQEESRKWELQVREWRDRATQAQQDLRQKCLLIANQLTTITDHEQRNSQLTRQLHDLEFTSHSQVVRAEESGKLAIKERERETKKMAKEIEKQKEQIQQLRLIVEQYKFTLAEQQHEVEQSRAQITNKLRQKDRQIKKVVKRQRQETEAKLNKSLSVDNSLVTNRLKASQVNLQSIVNSVIDLRTSNQRTSKLITRSIAPVRDIYYAT